MNPLLWALLIATPIPGTTPDTVTTGVPCRVARIVDGDTFTCEGGRRVRLLAIDAPERAQRPAGDSAKAALARLLPRDSLVTLELGRDSLDRYGRTLAYVWRADGRMANEEMLRRGWAVLYLYDRRNLQHRDRLQRAEETARLGRRGWWVRGEISCPPRDYRARRCGRAAT